MLAICGTDLAKILAYASHKNPSMVVWVAQRFGEEHKDALKWLNENRGSKSGPLFFGAEVRLARTGDAPSVPVFKLVLRPNGWKRRSASSDHPQEAMQGEIAIQGGMLDQDTGNLYDDGFVEVCDEWVVPYIGDLVGATLSQVSRTRFGRDPWYRVWKWRPPT